MNSQNTVLSMLLTALTLTACGDDGGTTNPTTTGQSTGASMTDTDPGTTTTVDPTTTTVDPSTTTVDPSATTTSDPSATTTSDPSESTTSDSTTTDGLPETTTIRVVHLSPGAPAVDIFANGNGDAPVVDALALRFSKTLVVPAGEYEFAISGDGSPIDEAVFNVPKLSYEAGKMYTVVAVGLLSKDTFNVLRIEDDAAGLDLANVRLQVTHAAAADAFAEVDVWSGPDAKSLTTLIPDFKFEKTGTVDVPPNNLAIGLDINNDAKPDATWAISGAALAQGVGTVVNVFAYSDDMDKPSLQIVVGDGQAIQVDPS